MSGELAFDADVPEDARGAIDEWYQENRDFGRVTPSLKGAIYFLISPLEDSVPPVSVSYLDWKGHEAEVHVGFRGNSQRFDAYEGTWKAEGFQIRDSMNYFHPSNPRYCTSWSQVFTWQQVLSPVQFYTALVIAVILGMCFMSAFGGAVLGKVIARRRNRQILTEIRNHNSSIIPIRSNLDKQEAEQAASSNL